MGRYSLVCIHRAKRALGGYAHTLSHVSSHAMRSGCLRSSQSCANRPQIIQPLDVQIARSVTTGTRLLSLAFGKDEASQQAAELSLAVLTAFATARSALTLVVALPLVSVLQRSLRHVDRRRGPDRRQDRAVNAGSRQRQRVSQASRSIFTATAWETPACFSPRDCPASPGADLQAEVTGAGTRAAGAREQGCGLPVLRRPGGRCCG
jgi:hypothetical protein